MFKPSASEITALEERLRQAMLTSNVAELDALIAPELLFASHLGQLVSKQQDLELHRSGVFQLTALVPSDQRIQLNGGFAVVSVQMHLLGSYHGTAVDQHIRYTRVWAVSSAGTVQIVAGHGSVVAS
ncbi:MAG: nuclear transport factor 2 family protein [Cyanobacteria bacterium]|nr:nuclear transport factor 2 family protein [Cyanobacteriota bacterium]MDA0865083.1 nuclear transport factor 2 family protein [Cyanobacteriota bacterium]